MDIGSTYFTFRVSRTLQDEFDAFCNEKGIPSSVAIKLFINRVINGERLNIKFGSFSKNYGSADSKVGLTINALMLKQFTDYTKTRYGIGRSLLIREFMQSCVALGDFPFDAYDVYPD